jgi:hypothetical protein
MLRRVGRFTAACSAAFAILGATALAAAGPPPPTSTNHHAVHLVASGLFTPTAFAFGEHKVFVGDGGNFNVTPPTPGGVFVLGKGKARLLAGSPPFVAGLAFRKGTLYVSAGDKLLAWRGWNGTQFTKRRVLVTPPKGFDGFNGIAFGADGRLYTGVSLGNTNDHRPSKAPFAFDVLSYTASGKHVRVVARGIRQPWQLAFPKGSSSPFVSDLGQDFPEGIKAPDFVLRVHAGDNYGFPKCNWTKPKPCAKFTRPLKFFAPHTDVGGLAIVGKRLYMSTFGFDPSQPARVLSMPLSGGKAKVLLRSAASLIGLGAHAGWLYVGDATNGRVFRVKP